MENYTEVINPQIKRISSWKPFLRQTLVSTGVWTLLFVYGLCLGAPTVFIPQIRKEQNSTEAISDGMASWLTSAMTFSSIPWVFVLCVLTRYIGRRIPIIMTSIDALIGFIIFYCSTSVNQILVSQIIQGCFSASHIIIFVLIITEYTSPRYRGIFLTLKVATLYWGIWASNAIGTYLHWKTIAIFGIIFSLYTLLTVFLWPESPYWLASRGRFEECATSHRWLKGCDEESEKELEDLINKQKEYLKSDRDTLGIKEKIKNVYLTMSSKEFYKPCLISMLTGTLGCFSGKLVNTVYAIDIIKKITHSEKTAYTGMLILDGITVLSMYFGCVLSKIVRRRPLLIISSSIGTVFLFGISLYLFLIKYSVISENKYVSLSLLTIFAIAISSGPLVMCTSVYAELIPVRSRNLSVCVIAIAAQLTISGLLKIAPYLFKGFGIHGTFLFFGLSSTVCIVLVYFYLPETKDKTLQEIADSIRGIYPINKEEATKLMTTVNKDRIVPAAFKIED
ncbi:hypothetical protein K1T71_006889 [Dendrolimus kikuchii]|uniref:Uncharacterized protein n=1 Tax=Dendrolimus kikuchii TaxID=765133 RepID=A0ACC1D2E6_9NEOP|nr:hypothetical protein K1T71_006889 [Dendrolimus kikuchii]